MYSDDVPVIDKAMRGDVNAFKRGLLFALCSIRQQVLNVPDQMERICRGDLEPLWGSKIKAWDYIESNADALWKRSKIALTPREAVNVLLRVPGLGIVKSAFVAQMMGHDVACLDSRNVKREGMNPRAYRTDGKAPYDLRRKVAHYCDTTQGRAQELWDVWCNEVAKANNMTGDSISRLHRDAIAAYDLQDTF